MNTANIKIRLKHKTIKWFKTLASLFLIVVSSSFQYSSPIPNFEDDKDDGLRIVSLYSNDFTSYVNQVYTKVNTTNDSIPRSVLEKSLRGYTYLKHTDQLSNTKYLSIIDFSRNCNKKRLWVIDMETKSIVFHELVAHGAKSGNYFAQYFSNTHSSNKSSLGFYTTGGTYYGSNNFSLKLNGLERKYNSNAFARGIVIHGASYVSNTYVKNNQRIGRSFGCPAVSTQVNAKLINSIKGGSCLFIYHPTADYLKNSTIMNANLYITVDELNS